jgi:hypothetical protein
MFLEADLHDRYLRLAIKEQKEVTFGQKSFGKEESNWLGLPLKNVISIVPIESILLAQEQSRPFSPMPDKQNV